MFPPLLPTALPRFLQLCSSLISGTICPSHLWGIQKDSCSNWEEYLVRFRVHVVNLSFHMGLHRRPCLMHDSQQILLVSFALGCVCFQEVFEVRRGNGG